MRGLTKGQPPPNVSPPGQEAGTLAAWAAIKVAELEGLYDWDTLLALTHTPEAQEAVAHWEHLRALFQERLPNDPPLPPGRFFLSANEYV